jgi:acyl-CoA reductase-like NAD-dependent aldehyde dehydrogenase
MKKVVEKWPIYINGAPIHTESHFVVENPATLEPVGYVPDANEKEAKAAVDAAQAAFLTRSKRVHTIGRNYLRNGIPSLRTGWMKSQRS